MSDPIVTFDEAAMRGAFRELVGRTVENALNALLEEEAMIKMCLAGVSARRIEDVSEILWGSSVSAATVSNLNERAFETVEKWRSRPLACDYPYVFIDGIAETLTSTCFPMRHWRRIRTNNAIERLNREICRRTRVVGAFPIGRSALMLVTARLKYVADSEWGSRRYMDCRCWMSDHADGRPPAAGICARVWTVPHAVGRSCCSVDLPLRHRVVFCITW